MFVNRTTLHGNTGNVEALKIIPRGPQNSIQSDTSYIYISCIIAVQRYLARHAPLLKLLSRLVRHLNIGGSDQHRASVLVQPLHLRKHGGVGPHSVAEDDVGVIPPRDWQGRRYLRYRGVGAVGSAAVGANATDSFILMKRNRRGRKRTVTNLPALVCVHKDTCVGGPPREPTERAHRERNKNRAMAQLRQNG